MLTRGSREPSGDQCPVCPKPPAPRRVGRQLGDRVPLDARHGCDEQLRDPHAPLDDEAGGAEVDQDDLHFAPVVGVDRAGGVQYRDAVLRGESRSRPDLRLEAGGTAIANPQGIRATAPGASETEAVTAACRSMAAARSVPYDGSGRSSLPGKGWMGMGEEWVTMTMT